MSDTLTLTVTSALKTGSTADLTDMSATDITCTEVFRAQINVPAGAADTSLKLNLLTDPLALIVIGGKGVSFKLDAGGTDGIAADPVAVISDDADGLAIDEILLSNDDAAEHSITVIAVE